MADVKQMRKEIEEMIQIILISIPREISSREFYLNAYNKARSERSQELFLSLANQEKNHENALRRTLTELQNELAELAGQNS